MSESQADRTSGSSPGLYNRMKVKSVARQAAYQPRQYVSDLNFSDSKPKAPVRWTQAPVATATAVAPTPAPTPAAVAVPQVRIVPKVEAVAVPVRPAMVAPVAPVRPQPAVVAAAPSPIVQSVETVAPTEAAVSESAYIETPAAEAAPQAQPAVQAATKSGLGLEDIEPVVSRPKVVIVAKNTWVSRLETIRNFGDRVDLSESKVLHTIRQLAKTLKKATMKAANSGIKGIASSANAVSSVKAPSVKAPAKLGRVNLTQWILGSAAAVVFTIGAVAGFQAQSANHQSDQKQVAALAEPKPVVAPAPVVQAPAQPVVEEPVVEPVAAKRPTIDKPTNEAINQYAVNPDQPRYLKIPAIGVNARVGQISLEGDGELAKPSNIYDAAWYTASAKPGPPGAVLLNGYSSSGETPGVFHDLGKLVAGDTLQVERGDGAVLTYKVARIEHIMAGKLDLRAAIAPVMAGRPGLNLVTASDDSKSGVMIVYAQQVQ